MDRSSEAEAAVRLDWVRDLEAQDGLARDEIADCAAGRRGKRSRRTRWAQCARCASCSEPLQGCRAMREAQLHQVTAIRNGFGWGDVQSAARSPIGDGRRNEGVAARLSARSAAADSGSLCCWRSRALALAADGSGLADRQAAAASRRIRMPDTQAASLVIPNWNGKDLLERFLPSWIAAIAGSSGQRNHRRR